MSVLIKLALQTEDLLKAKQIKEQTSKLFIFH